ncbi:hypothetical protein SALBM311S_10257 [Streptomyces alboniger]
MKPSRLAAVGALAATAVVVLSSPAFAHVSVQPEGVAAKGGYAVIDFKVPNERDNASTTKLEVNFPTDHPLASVMPEPLPGWDIKVTKSKLDKPVDAHGKQITEAAQGHPDRHRRGDQARLLREVPPLRRRTARGRGRIGLQGRPDARRKEVVRWIEEQKEGDEEPETPAPVLTLSAASEDGHHGSAAAEKASDGTNAARQRRRRDCRPGRQQ